MRAGKDRARMARPAPDYDCAKREPGFLALQVNGYSFRVRLDPNGRHVWRWNATINGQPWRTAGLEAIWRHLQAQMHPLAGRRR